LNATSIPAKGPEDRDPPGQGGGLLASRAAVSTEGSREPTFSPAIDEERLIERCVRDDPTAWQLLFQTYHPKLLFLIKSMMGDGSSNEQAEEVAAAVWSSLCGEGYSRLRQYNPRAGRLLPYLAGLARREIWRGRRSDRSRHLRECRAARKEATRDEIGRGLALNEFLATLTRREREFCLSHLLPPTEMTAPIVLSASNGWQLRSRVLKKFRTYFKESPQ
jgi:DNA-directed RNA polymerase specialized sigma24 family protein